MILAFTMEKLCLIACRERFPVIACAHEANGWLLPYPAAPIRFVCYMFFTNLRPRSAFSFQSRT